MGFAHHDCRAAEKSEQSEYDQGARYARAPLPPAIITRYLLEGRGSGLRRAENASQEVCFGAAGPRCGTVEDWYGLPPSTIRP